MSIMRIWKFITVKINRENYFVKTVNTIANLCPVSWLSPGSHKSRRAVSGTAQEKYPYSI